MKNYLNWLKSKRLKVGLDFITYGKNVNLIKVLLIYVLTNITIFLLKISNNRNLICNIYNTEKDLNKLL